MKTYIAWDEKYNTGITTIDCQHKMMVHLINTLEGMTEEKELKPKLLKIVFGEVYNYADYHFKTEEKIMGSFNYSKLKEQELIHREFKEKLDSLKIEAEKGTSNIDRKFCDFLKDWLLNHIAKEDQQITQEMKAKGISLEDF